MNTTNATHDKKNANQKLKIEKQIDAEKSETNENLKKTITANEQKNWFQEKIEEIYQ